MINLKRERDKEKERNGWIDVILINVNYLMLGMKFIDTTKP